MSDASFEPSSDGPGTTWALSQQHQSAYDDYMTERRMRQQETGPNKRPKLEDDTEASVKQESPSPSPCTTPRVTAQAANIKTTLQYAAALNSQMGENTFVEQLFDRAQSPVSLPLPDETDIDLLRLKCIEFEIQRDDAIDARDEAVGKMREAWEELERVREDLYRMTAERDAAVDKHREWKAAAVSARKLIRLASKEL